MRTLAKLALTSLLASSFFSVPALAADQNTYRAGTPYLKTVAYSFQQCEQHCKGDAACRGWNFVRPNAGSNSGVCEFNSRNAAPVNSPISMSGIISTSVDTLMSRAVPAGAHTIRVGAPTAPKSGAVISRRGKTIVKRMPVPQKQPSMRAATHARPALIAARPPAVRAQDPRRPRVYGNVNAAPKTRTAPIAPRTAAPQPNLTPEQAYYRDQYLARKRQQDQMQSQQLQARQQQQAMIRRPQAPQGRMIPPMPAQQMPMQQMPMQPSAPQQRQQQPQGLYGNLHDDLTQNMTPVPRPRTAPDNIANPDAPMATSRAMPSTPVQAAPLNRPAIPALAGG